MNKVNYDSPVDENDEVMTVDEFIKAVDAGAYIDYDGVGYPACDISCM